MRNCHVIVFFSQPLAAQRRSPQCHPSWEEWLVPLGGICVFSFSGFWYWNVYDHTGIPLPPPNQPLKSSFMCFISMNAAEAAESPSLPFHFAHSPWASPASSSALTPRSASPTVLSPQLPNTPPSLPGITWWILTFTESLLYGTNNVKVFYTLSHLIPINHSSWHTKGFHKYFLTGRIPIIILCGGYY